MIQKLSRILAVFSLFATSMNATASVDRAAVLQASELQQIATVLSNSVENLNVIDWKVGDRLEYNLKLAGFPLGTSHKEVIKDEGTSLWFRQAINASIQNIVTDIHISKTDASILKVYQCGANVKANEPCTDGKEQNLDAGDVEVIKQEYAEITVPAGTFKVIYILAKSSQSEKIEAWMNPRDIPMDGTAKQSVAMQFGELSLELTKFKRVE